MSRAVSFFRIASLVLGSRSFRALLGVAAAIWVFDQLIFEITQCSFFASVRLEGWFWRELGARVGLFATFFGICLGLTQIFLGAVTRAALDESFPLRGALAQLDSGRKRIARVAWNVALLLAFLLSRDFSTHSWDWIFLRGGARSDFAFLGIGAALWTHFLPVFAPFLLCLWKFSLALGLLLGVTAVLRALPVLASRNAAPPEISRLLWRYGAFLWALRAALYGLQVLDLGRGRALSSGDLFLLAPFWMLGALACGALCVAFLRRARQTTFVMARAKSSKWALSVLAALFLPAIAAVLSAPLRAFLPATPYLKRQREMATRAAWRLNGIDKEGFEAQNPASIERIWPVWDEKSLLASRPGAGFRGARVVTWKSATLDFQNGAWSAIVAGESAGAAAWNSSREAGDSTSLELERLEWQNEKWRPAPLPDARPVFFGWEGRSLFGSDDSGISLASLPWKWAWAWRLRDLFLPLDARTSPHLLTFRGARERAQILAPFLSGAGEPRLVSDGENWIWALDLCAASRNFPGAPALNSSDLESDFSGANAVSSPLQMRMNARTGQVRFVVNSTKNQGRDALLDSWRAAFPEIEIEENAPAPRDSFNTNSCLAASFGVSGDLLRAQAGIAAQESGEDAQIGSPQTFLDSRNDVASEVVSIEKNRFEVWQSAASGSFRVRGEGDLRARIERLDAAIAQSGGAEKEALFTQPLTHLGGILVWRDPRAPGGFWVGRAYFAARRGETDSSAGLSAIAEHGPVLWRVALSGVAPGARVGVGASLREALVGAGGSHRASETPPLAPRSEFSSNASLNAPLNSGAARKAPSSANELNAPLEVQALQTHQALQSAAMHGDWKAFGALAARETALLERLAARRQNQAQPLHSTKNQTTTSNR